MGYTAEMFNIGHRVVVYGTTGSGKTTVAARIARSLGVTHIELDAIFWLPDWTKKTPDDFRDEVTALLESHQNGWVCDGNYSRVRNIILPQADTVIWLRLPFRVTFWRVLKRTVSRAWTREPLWGTNYESWRQSFLSWDSLLRYSVTGQRRHRRGVSRSLNEVSHRAKVYELRSTREVDVFLAGLRTHDNQVDLDCLRK
jgi:adenylate kinase family enzyme